MSNLSVSQVPDDRLRELAAFMAERHAIYMRKAYIETTTEDYRKSGRMSVKMRQAWHGVSDLWRVEKPEPSLWSLDRLTDDPILAQYRFCNVYRELDRVTVWIRENIREPYADHEHLWFMLCAARQINWPDTLSRMILSTRAAWPDKDGFCPEFMTDFLLAHQQAGRKVYTGAYMIRAEQFDRPWRHWPKVRYTAELVLGRLWEDREDIAALLAPNGPSGQRLRLQDFWELLQHPRYVGWGPFMAHQVVADLRWTRYLRRAPDAGDWTAVGPGSARGLNRLHGRPLTAAVSQEQGLAEMRAIRQAFLERVPLAPWLDVPELSDIQNCLCEFDKYERVRLGEGRPRARYVPGRGY